MGSAARGATALALEIQRGSKLQQDNQALSKMNPNVFGNRNASQANSSTVEANLMSQMYPQQQYPPLAYPLGSSFTTKSSKKSLNQKIKH